MNKRLNALQLGQPTYNSGKPCRRGHISDRYSSNGMCIECLKLQNTAAKTTGNVARGKYNLARAANMVERKFMVRERDRDTMQKLCDVLQFGTPAMLETIKAQIDAIHDACPNPRILSYNDLIRFIDWRDGVIRNMVELDISRPEQEDPEICIYKHGHRYSGVQIMEVLRGQRINVAPF